MPSVENALNHVRIVEALGAAISMGLSESLSDDGSLTGRGAPVLRGAVFGGVGAGIAALLLVIAIAGLVLGRLLRFLVAVTAPRLVLEIGTFTGYSSICIARGLPDGGGHLLCCDVSEEWTAIGRRYWQEAGVAHKIDLRIAKIVNAMVEQMKAATRIPPRRSPRPPRWRSTATGGTRCSFASACVTRQNAVLFSHQPGKHRIAGLPRELREELWAKTFPLLAPDSTFDDEQVREAALGAPHVGVVAEVAHRGELAHDVLAGLARGGVSSGGARCGGGSINATAARCW